MWLVPLCLFVASERLTLKKIVPLLVAHDHLHNSRWLPVFINDLESLPITNSGLYNEFLSGKFAVPATSTSFSKMAYDQIHEQNNKIIKANSGYINIVNKKMKSFLGSWKQVPLKYRNISPNMKIILSNHINTKRQLIYSYQHT